MPILDVKYHRNLAAPSSRWQGYGCPGSPGIAPPGWHQPLSPGQALRHHTGMGLCARGRPRADLLGDPGLLLVVKEPQTHRQGLSPRQAPVFFRSRNLHSGCFAGGSARDTSFPRAASSRWGTRGDRVPWEKQASPAPGHPPQRLGGVTERGVTWGL